MGYQLHVTISSNQVQQMTTQIFLNQLIPVLTPNNECLPTLVINSQTNWHFGFDLSRRNISPTGKTLILLFMF